MRLRRITREDVSETTWRWRYKIRTVLKRSDKTVADFSSGSSFLDDPTASEPPKHDGTSKSKTSDAGDESKFGATPAVKTLYERRNSSDSSIDWVDYPPKQMSKSATNAHDRVGIKVYKVRDPDKPTISGRVALKYSRIDVQNFPLVAALEEILKKQDHHLEIHETATFYEPFSSLFFCYGDIVTKYKTIAEGDHLKQHMLLFIKVLDDVFGDLRAKRKSLLAGGLITYKLAWTLFPRDCEVISWGNNGELILKIVDTMVRWTSTTTNVLVLRCKVLRFNGEAFVWHDTELEIPQFENNKPILDLPHYPMSFLADAEGTKKRLAERGRKVLDLQGLAYRTYTGIGIYVEGKRVEKHNVDGRVLIDVVGFNKHHLAQGIRETRDPDTRKNTIRNTGRPPHPLDKKAIENAVIARRLDEKEQKKNKDTMLEREHDLHFMVPVIEGYALKNKLWLSFFVEDIKPMVWNDKAFEHLVHDEEQKDLVLAFVENHNRSKPMKDVIMGKGEGLIVLLSGPPGTGKTLTAEAVADRTRRPLFYLQAEDLGINAAVLGANVKRVFEMASEWNAVILLDEADVFMAERHPQDIARNELVSIFLRELEYFRGIIFLTTNLYNTIDPAFRSRVSLHLLFKPLGPEAREIIWRNFLDRLPVVKSSKSDEATETLELVSPATGNQTKPAAEKADVEVIAQSNSVAQEEIPDNSAAAILDVTDEDIKELATWNLNGREIKNAVKMVKSWCDYKGAELTLAKLENGIRATNPHATKSGGQTDMSLYDD